MKIVIQKMLLLFIVLWAHNNYTSQGTNTFPNTLTLYTNGYIPISAVLSRLVNDGCEVVASNTNSAIATVTNYVSDDAALLKLGYSSTSSISEQELRKWHIIKERHMQEIVKNKTMTLEQFKNDAEYIKRRRVYIERAIRLIPERSDGINIALFCLKHYQDVMDPFKIAYVNSFAQRKAKKAQKRVAQLEKEYNDILTADNSKPLRDCLQDWFIIEKDHIGPEQK